jgi:glyoxylase-like metal-dependent hydrolase (beta-lactamase superfamily II)
MRGLVQHGLSMRIHTIDLQFQGCPGLIASYVLETQAGLAIIETGPASCHAALVEGLRQLGAAPAEVRHVFLTHIHLDHSGAAGWWAQQGAQVYVHGKGAPHLIDPSKLIQSATMIYGERMQQLWGEILPAPAERVTVLAEGAEVTLGEVQLSAWDTPGHARHHLVFTAGDVCFSGDQAGMLYPGTHYLSVTSAPPQFEPPEYIQSVQRMRAAGFREMYLTHFGLVSEVDAHLAQYEQLLATATERMTAWVKEGLSSADIHERYQAEEYARARASGVNEQNWAMLQSANSTQMCSAGMERWVRKHQAAAPTAG